MYLDADAEGVVALAALGAGQEAALCTQAEAATHHAHVLGRRGSQLN